MIIITTTTIIAISRESLDMRAFPEQSSRPARGKGVAMPWRGQTTLDYLRLYSATLKLPLNSVSCFIVRGSLIICTMYSYVLLIHVFLYTT